MNSSTKRFAGYAGWFLAVAGGIIVGSALSRTNDVPTSETAASLASAEAVRAVEQRFGNLEQRLAAQEAAARSGSAPTTAIAADLKQTIERLEALAAKLPNPDALQERAAELEKIITRGEMLAQALVGLEEQAGSRLTALDASLDRAAAAQRVAAAQPRSAPAPKPRPARAPAPAEDANSRPAANPPVPTPPLLEPAAGPSDEAPFWARWPATSATQFANEGAEGTR